MSSSIGLNANSVRRAINDASHAFGTFVLLDGSISMSLIARAGYDFAVLDLQHAPFDTLRIEGALAACQGTQCSPLARVRPGRPDQIEWMLDMGAHGIVVPLVNTAHDAQTAADACRYPPLGRRSMGAGRSLLTRGHEYPEWSNDDVVCIVQIEHHEAVQNIEAILDTPGIDAIMPGHVDLAGSMGYRLSYGASVSNVVPTPVADAIAHIEQAARARSIPVIPVTGNVSETSAALSQGHHIVCVSTDYHTFRAAASDQVRQCRALLSVCD